MVMVLGHQEEDRRFIRYFESKDTLSVILANPDVTHTVLNQLTGLNRHVFECALISNATQRYQKIYEKICEYVPHHIAAFTTFCDVTTVAFIYRDRCEQCGDTNACERFSSLIYGDPDVEGVPQVYREDVSRGLMGQWKLSHSIVAAEVLVALGVLDPKDVTDYFKGESDSRATASAEIAGCPICRGVYKHTECVRAKWDDRTEAMWLCRKDFMDLQAQGRITWFDESTLAAPAAAAPAGAPTGIVCTNCHADLRTGALFCDKCGTRITPATAGPTGQPPRLDLPEQLLPLAPLAPMKPSVPGKRHEFTPEENRKISENLAKQEAHMIEKVVKGIWGPRPAPEQKKSPSLSKVEKEAQARADKLMKERGLTKKKK
jgi:hypothetical protein